MVPQRKMLLFGFACHRHIYSLKLLLNAIIKNYMSAYIYILHTYAYTHAHAHTYKT